MGLVKNILYGFSKAKYDYFAICEGDDYWTNYDKLSIQYKFLVNHFNYNAHFMWYHDLNDKTKKILKSDSDPYPGELNLNKVFQGKLRIPTRTVMFKRQILSKELIDSISSSKYYDLVLNFYYFVNGNVYFDNNIVAVYRKRAGGLSSNNSGDKAKGRLYKMNIWISTWDLMLISFGSKYLDDYRVGLRYFCRRYLFKGNESFIDSFQLLFNSLIFNIFRKTVFMNKIEFYLTLFRGFFSLTVNKLYRLK